ncbi:MAG: aminotransferase class I/II-fold pyridoxal phosphate-dependent enzyme, partial [Treponema sp.]|nr:aminotransferase class I/II-fold pyridoxal phosphate-dependent enzyme [Treponema sp.]
MIAPHIKEAINSKSAGVIRKMFEEGMILRQKYGAENVFDFSIGNPDLEPPVEVIEAIKEVAFSTEKGRHGYMPNAGYQSTRKAMADKVSLEQAVTLGWENIVMSVGAASALNAIFKAILSVNDEVIVPSPFFAEYTNYVKNYSGILVTVPTKKTDFSLDIASIKSALSEKTAAVLINSPNNPTGKIYSEEEIIELTDILKEHGKKYSRMPYLICDEPYRAIAYDGKKVSPVFPHYDNAIIASSFAKNLSLPGERMGYIAVNPSCEDAKEFIAA